MKHAPVEFAMAARGRARRIKLGLSVRQVADRLNRAPERVYQMEQDGVGTVDLVRRWAKALGMPPGELAFGPEAPR